MLEYSYLDRSRDRGQKEEEEVQDRLTYKTNKTINIKKSKLHRFHFSMFLIITK
jgi:hypothetical protein